MLEPHKPGLYVHLPLRTFKEGDLYLARCDPLEISDQGKTKKQALENLVHTLSLFFATSLVQGTLPKLLQDKGITTSDTLDKNLGETVPIPIPVELLTDRNAIRNRAY